MNDNRIRIKIAIKNSIVLSGNSVLNTIQQIKINTREDEIFTAVYVAIVSKGIKKIERNNSTKTTSNE